MDPFAEPEFLSTQIIEGALDVHPSKNAIVVHYSVDARVLSEHMETMVADMKQCRKIINIGGLTPSTDISALARHIVSQTHLIQPARLPEVEQLLVYLLSRKQSKPGFQDDDILSASSKEIRQQLDDCQNKVDEVASLMDLTDYLELLYEELTDKIRGTGLILQLARNPDNLLELASNESLFLALTRVLRDDWRKSIELSCNIIYIFFCFSTFSNFHRMLIHHKVGSLCMTVVEHEIQRYQTLYEDMETKRKGARSTPEGKSEYDKSKKRLQAIMKKQETLLRVCLYLLLNLAESPSIEQKMKNKGIISHLISLLQRDCQELIILVVSFLKKLSIYGENKDEMVKENILKKLLQLIPCENEILVNVTVRLLMNLSFDPTVRESMITLGFLPKLVALLNDEAHHIFVLFVLYHISMDEKGRAAYVYTDCVPNVMKLLLEAEEPPDPEVLALGINLACHIDNAQLMCQGPGLKLLMNKALKTQDPLLMKMIRNISQHPGDIKRLFLDFLVDLGRIITTCQEDEFIVEVLGILGNISLPDLDYNRVLTQLNLLPSLIDKLKDPKIKDDIILEVVIVCGTFSYDTYCAELMVKAGLPQLLIDILKAKQDDDEMILQITYNFHQILLHPSTRDAVMTTEAPDYLIELINDKNKEVSKVCSQVLDIMAEHNAEFRERVKLERFRYYNQQWLEMVTGQTIFEEEQEEDEDYMDPYYLHMAAELHTPDLLETVGLNGLTSPVGLGRVTPLPGQPVPMYTSPNDMMYDDEYLVGYGMRSPIDNDAIMYSGGLYYDPVMMGEVIEYEDHPAFAMTENTGFQTHRVFHQPMNTNGRPPSRLNF